LTSTGVTAVEGKTIAVDPNIIPYGSTVLIDGKEYLAQDCGGAIKGNKIDVFVESPKMEKQVTEVYLKRRN
jgi:3D (Asp-Asp-Asp) domain-containing protein